MTLRRRLVAVLLMLVALGLALLSVVSYQLYSRIEYSQLNAQLHSASPLLAQFAGRNYLPQSSSPAGRSGFRFVPPGSQPDQGGSSSHATSGSAARRTNGGRNGRTDRPAGTGPDNLPEGSYVELRGATGRVLADSQHKIGCYSTDPKCAATPKLPALLTASSNPAGRTFTDGSDQFRVLVRPLAARNGLPAAGPFRGDLVVTAIPLAGIHRSLDHLIRLDLLVGAAVLVALSAAGLVLLRRGLAPLERIAGTARAITAGDLTQRAPYSDRKTEVGQLGWAFNSMMARIELAFSERDATEERLRRFLADASHELRTPLTSIRGYAELWHMGAVSPGEELEMAMMRIEQHAREMSSLVEELLLLARLDQTRPPQRTPVDLAVLAAESLGDVAVTAPDRRFALDAPEPVTVIGDAVHLRQALTNLLINAVRYTPSGRPVELGLHQVDGVAVLTVRDHGDGLSAEGLQRAFDRFWRADSARGRQGSGLGLAIVAAVATEHGGRASVANAPDGGAVFTIRLPVPLSSLGLGAPQAVVPL